MGLDPKLTARDPSFKKKLKSTFHEQPSIHIHIYMCICIFRVLWRCGLRGNLQRRCAALPRQGHQIVHLQSATALTRRQHRHGRFGLHAHRPNHVDTCVYIYICFLLLYGTQNVCAFLCISHSRCSCPLLQVIPQLISHKIVAVITITA